MYMEGVSSVHMHSLFAPVYDVSYVQPTLIFESPAEIVITKFRIIIVELQFTQNSEIACTVQYRANDPQLVDLCCAQITPVLFFIPSMQVR